MKLCTSLESFCSHFSGVCTKVTWEWCQYVHCRQEQTFDSIADVWNRCISCKPESRGTREMLRFLLGQGAEVDVTFPGPLCSPLRRSDLHLLQSQPYWVTEKSDGVRIILASTVSEHFPCWRVMDGERCATALSLIDVIHFEAAWHRLPQSTELVFRGETWTFSDKGAAEKKGSYTLERDGAPVVVMRREVSERQFAYFFDRAMDAVYLFHDEYRTKRFKKFLLDGELMYLYETGQEEEADAPCWPGLGFFDLFSYSTNSAAYLSTNMREQPLAERLSILKEICLAVDQVASVPVFWFCKEMWPVENLEECVMRIQKRKDCYIFCRDEKMCSLNDGLIFTPDHFPIIEGASMTQLKWKWLNMLSVDWLITPSRTREDEYKVSVYFHKKNFGHREDVSRHWELRPSIKLLNPHQLEVRPTDSVVAECTYDAASGNWRMERIRHDKTVANSVITVISVFECLAENLTLTSLAGAVKQPVDGGGVNGGSRNAGAAPSSFVHLEASAASTSHNDEVSGTVALPTKHRFAKFTLRAIKNLAGLHTLVLSSYTTREDNLHPIPFPIGDAERRVELYDLPDVTDGTCIKNLLYIALGNAGGSEAWSDFVVEAFYDGARGKWVVVNLYPHGDNKECTFNSVLQHLSWLIKIGGGDRARRYVPSKGAHLPTVVLPSCVLPETNRTNAHYASKTRELSDKTGKRSNLRVFNNWIKSVLIHVAVERVKTALLPLVVLDVCCGRGGDLPKWKMYSPKLVFMTDSSIDCVGEAAARYSTGQGSVKTARNQHSFDAHFAVLDAFDAHGGRGGLREKICSLVRKKKTSFTAVSCQFSMHYGCYSKERLAYFVECVSSALSSGGLFIGTTVSDEELLRRFKVYQSPSFGNSVYKITFLPESVPHLEQMSDSTQMEYGIAYRTSVEDSVSELNEYVVPWHSFTALCEVHHLRLVDSFSFSDYYVKHMSMPYGQELFEKVLHQKRSRTGTHAFNLTDDEKAAVGIYRGFIFRKVTATMPQ